jgi:hypothetical protein
MVDGWLLSGLNVTARISVSNTPSPSVFYTLALDPSTGTLCMGSAP